MMIFVKVTNALRKPFLGAQVNFKVKNTMAITTEENKCLCLDNVTS